MPICRLLRKVRFYHFSSESFSEADPKTSILVPKAGTSGDSRCIHMPANNQPGDLLTKEELRLKLNLPSTRMVDELVRRRKIPVIKLGHKTVRFHYERVRAALDKLEIKEVGRK